MELRAAIVSVTLTAASVAYADTAKPTITTAPVKQSELPRGVTARGNYLSGVKFTDKNGVNYVLFSTTSSSKPVGADEVSRSAMLYVENWIVRAKGSPRNLLPVRDMVTDCQMGDVDAAFHDAAFAVTDLDGDGIAEVTFGYELACRSDVSPATYKLLVLENGTKYILRGETIVDPGDGPMGGTFKADPAEPKWPAVFLAHAKQMWTKTSADSQIHR